MFESYLLAIEKLNHPKSDLAFYSQIRKNHKTSHARSGHGNMAIYTIREKAVLQESLYIL